MKFLTAFCFLLCSTALVAQTDNMATDGWKFGGTFSPDMYLNSSSLETSEHTGYSLEPAGFSYTAGLTVQREVASRLDVGVGVGYSQKQYSGVFYCAVCDFFQAPVPEPIKLTYTEVQVNTRYRFIDQKYGMHVESALIGSYAPNNINTLQAGTILGSEYLLGGQVGIGSNVDIGKRLNMSLTATYRHTFTDFLDDTDMRLRSLGLRTALVYRLARKA